MTIFNKTRRQQGWRKQTTQLVKILTYSLTPRCRVLPEQLTGLQPVKKLPAFHGTRRFITALTSVRHLSLSWASPIQSIYPHPISCRSVLILSTHLRLGLPCSLFPSGFPHQDPIRPPLLPGEYKGTFLQTVVATGYEVRTKFPFAPRKPSPHNTHRSPLFISYTNTIGNIRRKQLWWALAELILQWKHSKYFIFKVCVCSSLCRCLCLSVCLSVSLSLSLSLSVNDEIFFPRIGTSRSCSQAVNKPVWHISLQCVQWEKPDDGQRNCPKHVSFNPKILLRN